MRAGETSKMHAARQHAFTPLVLLPSAISTGQIAVFREPPSAGGKPRRILKTE